MPTRWEMRGHEGARGPSPEDVPAVFAERFNSGDLKALGEVYEDDGVLVLAPDTPLTGQNVEEASARFVGLGVPITVRPRHIYAVGDIALLIVDWVIDGTGADGNPVHIEGTATDVARRGPDGRWRYVIDNPFGTAGDTGP